MPFTDPVSSMSGRNSRASNVSGMTRASHSVRSGPTAPNGKPSNDMLNSVGVLSMLKTSTDTGDIGALSFNQTRLPTMPRATHHRKGHGNRQPSISSDLPRGSSHHYPNGTGSHHHYAPSQTSRISDSTSFIRRGSFTSMQSMPPSLPPVHSGKAILQMPAPTLDRGRDSRSYSMTSAPATGQLPRHRSASSLKSAGHEPRQTSRLHSSNVPPMPENRPPYVYPTRLKRPGYRSPSPALSDLSAQGQPMHHLPPMPPPHRRPGVPMQRPQPQTYVSYDGQGYVQDGHYLNVHPPPRSMNTSPVLPYEQGSFGYRPGPMRSDPVLPMPHPQHHRQPYPGPHARSGYPVQQYGPPRPGYPQYPPMPHPTQMHSGYRGPPPQASMAPMAHHMFHNAARMARQIPQRVDTPMTDMGPPSSDPPSSGNTAPTSSSPPTPKDHSTIHVAVDPIFIDPALTDLPDSSSEPVLPAKYFEFAEGLEKPIEESDVEVPHPSVPPTGFVQRVKAMLESRAAIEAAAKKEVERERAAVGQQPATRLIAEHEMADDVSELHELAANETPRFTIVEEFDAPVELPASPIKIAELSCSPPKPKEERRLTRELVKAELASTSMIADSTTGAEETTSTADIDINITLQREGSKQTSSSRSTDTSTHSADGVQDTPSTKRQPSNAGSAGTASPDAISGIDYALRFSVPIDSTAASEETQSRDPFILDADTITLQHQRSKEKVPQVQSFAAEEQKCPDESRLTAPPVSPLQSGEDVSRSSAVSPLQTQTLGIDETLRLGMNTKQDDTTNMDQSALGVGSTTEDALPPPTPRTPKTYSKSVQLPPSSVTTTETPSTNRFSLPPDLSTVADTTMNTNSDMITDVAVRFSLPNTTITIGKPQIVTIPPSSSPEKPESPPPKSAARNLGPRSARRNSVTFADQVAPLNIRKPEPRREQQYNEPTVNKGKSIMRRPSPMEDSTESSRASRESTTELRFPPGNGINARFGSTHLPRLKEESIEDMSISDKHHKHSSSQANNQQLMLPARIAAVKAMQERRLQESAEKAKARRAARHHNRPLADIRDLPSLNFSRMDLIDKLNEALEIRPAKSMEIVRRRDFSAIYCPSPQRPQSTEPLRDRYASFFSKPEDFDLFDFGEEEPEVEEEPAVSEQIPIVEVQESTKLEDVDEELQGGSQHGSRPLSPEDFLNVATQVNRLSIPSVSGLSDKLTNLLPALKNLHLDSVLANDEEVAHTIDDIHALGNSRPDTVLSSRTSAGFRTLAERAEEIVQHGTHDSMVPGLKLLTNKELPPLPESASADKVSAMNSLNDKQSYLSGSVSAPSDLGKDPIRPASALLRKPVTEDEVRQLLPPEMNPITRSKRSLIISSASRPWNQDENYPWAGTNVPVDLSIPSEAHARDSITAELDRTRRSRDFTTSGEDTSQGIDIGSIMTTLDRSASITTMQATGVSPRHARKPSKRSIIGSISKKMGLASRSTIRGDETTITRTLPSPAMGSSDTVTQPHKPGERYPTSSLTPPVALHLDEVRSFFSDESSEKQGHPSFRKRLTGFRTKSSKAVRLDATRDATRSATGVRGATSLDGQNTAYDAGSLNAERLGAMSSSAHTIDGVGMGKAEFRMKRFGEKLRNLIAKGGDLFRTLSGKSRGPRRERIREDWLSDSLYSGV